MKERILALSLSEAVDRFQGIKWLFYSVEPEKIKIEVPRGTSESFVVEVSYKDAHELETFKKILQNADFIEQRVNMVIEY